jgi:hypothetical protein
MRFHALLILIAIALAWAAPAAHAQKIRRCATAQGATVYTDKRCEDIGATDRLPAAAPLGGVGGRRLHRDACSRTLADLVQQIAEAVNARDVNRLAGVYQWNGVSDASASRILDQLEAVVSRPLVDIVPVRPPPPPVLDEQGMVVDGNQDNYYPQTYVRQRPVGLRLEQTLANGSTPSQTVFGLRRSYNCFWITL